MHWSFPWTMHLGITEFRAFADELDKFSTGPEEKDCVLKNVEHGGLTVDLERLNASRQALSKLCKDSRDFNHIATFALGGFVPLYYLASKQGGFDDSKKTKYHLHLFAGLAWAAKREIGNNLSSTSSSRWEVRSRFSSSTSARWATGSFPLPSTSEPCSKTGNSSTVLGSTFWGLWTAQIRNRQQPEKHWRSSVRRRRWATSTWCL